MAQIDKFKNEAEPADTFAAFLAQDDPSVDPVDVTEAISVPTAATPAEPCEGVA